ncbi:MAG: type II/IV secretion system ATPase subunit [Candidatus Pacearchaeota archaeon]
MIEIKPLDRAPSIKDFQDKTKINLIYPLLAPFAYAHIFFDPTSNQVVYNVIEPPLTNKEVLERIKNLVKENINIKNDYIEKEKKQEYIENLLNETIELLRINVEEEEKRRIFYYLYRDFIGLNEIEPLMNDPFIEDIQCNGIDSPIYIVHRIFRNLKTNIIFKDIDSLASFVEKLAQKCGRYVSYANPILDGSLADGSRVNATYTKDITSKGPTFTIRKFSKIPLTPINLIQNRSASPEMLAYFWILMQYKLNVLVAGGTGSGKTTLLNAIAFFIPPEARVVSIEDTRELNLPRENWLPSVVRESVSGEVGEVDMFSLLKASFRQIPDYVIVGEVRGKEAAVLFQGMASGHSCLSTIHADSLDAIVRRLETPPIELSPSLINELDCIAIMTHARVGEKETRKLREVVEVVNVNPDGTAQGNIPLIWDPAKDKFYFKKDFHAFRKIEKRNGIPYNKLIDEFILRTRILNEMSIRGISSVDDVKNILLDYSKNPQTVLRKLGLDVTLQSH